jgi:hypothetical protein
MFRNAFFEFVDWMLKAAFCRIYGSNIGLVFEPQWQAVVHDYLSGGVLSAAEVDATLEKNRFLGQTLDRTAVALGVPPFMRHLLEDKLSDLIKTKVADYLTNAAQAAD